MPGSALRRGDVLALYLDDDDDARGCSSGYLGSDPTGELSASADETLLIVPMMTADDGRHEYPSSFQARCLYRIGSGRGREALGHEILYGQTVNLVHVNTGMHLAAVSADEVRLVVDTSLAAEFTIQPRYKVRAEGEKVYASDHVVLASRRFTGCYLHSSSLSDLDEESSARPVRPSPSAKARATEGAPGAAGGASPPRVTERRWTPLDGAAARQHTPSWVRPGFEPQRVDLTNQKTAQGWVVQRFAPHDADGAGALRGGDYVRLFHREAEAYLRAGLDTEAERARAAEGALDAILTKA